MTDDINEKRRESAEKDAREEYDVFLSYNSKDREEVKIIGNWLKDNGIAPWLDEWGLQPGLLWQPLVEEQIKRIKSAAVFVGKMGMGSWQKMETYAFLSAFVSRGCPVIPVLLPDAPFKPELPIFLSGMTWVDFRTNDPDPLKRLIWGITSKRTQKVYRPGIMIASLGDSPLVVTAMYDLLQKREKLTLDRVEILHPDDRDVKDAYKCVREVLTDVQEIQSVRLEFEDADSWTNACVFLQRLCERLRSYQKQDNESVYLSLAGGRKSMAALMAWAAPYFTCVKGLYHISSREEGSAGREDFPLIQAINEKPIAERSQMLHPDLSHLSVVKIPLHQGEPLSKNFFSKLSSLIPDDFELAEAVITGRTIFQDRDILKVEVTQRVIEQFCSIREANADDAWLVRNTLLEMSQIATLQALEARSQIDSYPVPKKIPELKGVVLHSLTGLSAPIQPIFYTEPVDISSEADTSIKRVVICSLETKGEHGYKTLKELAPELAPTIKQTFSIDKLTPPPSPTESVLIVPLGEAPMVATQLYTLLTEVERHTIREVVLIYPQDASTIHNGARMIRNALLVKDNSMRCTLAGIPELADITSSEDCITYQNALETEIERVKNEYRDSNEGRGIKIDLALSGGRKGMTAMTIFAAQKHHIPYVYHTLITDEKERERIEDETTYDKLNATSMSQQERLNRLFLQKYRDAGPCPYSNFTLFRVPVFTGDGW